MMQFDESRPLAESSSSPLSSSSHYNTRELAEEETKKLTAAIENCDERTLEGASKRVELSNQLLLLTKDPEFYIHGATALDLFERLAGSKEGTSLPLQRLLLSQVATTEHGVKEVVKLLESSDENTKVAAAYALKGKNAPLGSLLKLLNNSSESTAQLAAAEALSGRPDAVDALAEALRGIVNPELYKELVDAIVQTPGPEALICLLELQRTDALQMTSDGFAQLLSKRTDAEDLMLEQMISRVPFRNVDPRPLARVLKGKPGVAEEVLKHCQSEGPIDREEFCIALSGHQAAKDILIKTLEQGYLELKVAAARALKGVRGAEDALLKSLESDSNESLQVAVAAATPGNETTLNPLFRIANDGARWNSVRFEALKVLVERKNESPQSVIRALKRALQVGDSMIREVAIRGLKDVEGEEETLLNALYQNEGDSQLLKLIAEQITWDLQTVRKLFEITLRGGFAKGFNSFGSVDTDKLSKQELFAWMLQLPEPRGKLVALLAIEDPIGVLKELIEICRDKESEILSSEAAELLRKLPNPAATIKAFLYPENTSGDSANS